MPAMLPTPGKCTPLMHNLREEKERTKCIIIYYMVNGYDLVYDIVGILGTKRAAAVSIS